MASAIQLKEFESASGKIYIQFDELVGTGKNWLAPAKMLGMDITSFILMLKKDYEAETTVYRKDGKVSFIGYHWTSLAMARKFKNRLNKIAREKNITEKLLINML